MGGQANNPDLIVGLAISDVTEQYRASRRPAVRAAMLGHTTPRDKHQWHRAAIPPGPLSSGGGLHTLGGLFDKSCDSPGLRHVDGVATLDLNDGRASPLGHGTLRIRRNHLVVGSDQVPARLGLPRRFADLAA